MDRGAVSGNGGPELPLGGDGSPRRGHGYSAAEEWFLRTGVLPSGSLPAGTLPGGGLPAEALPGGGLPPELLPAGSAHSTPSVRLDRHTGRIQGLPLEVVREPEEVEPDHVGEREQELARVLADSGFPEHVVRHLCAVSTVLRTRGESATPAGSETPAGSRTRAERRASAEELTAAVDGLVVLQRWSEAALSGVAVDLMEVTGEEFLARKRVASPDELSKTAREDWRARTKSTLAHELQLLTGWGIQDCHDRVGFAVAPRQAASIPLAALASGEVGWSQVRAWWQACRRMPVEVAAEVAARMFGPDSDRARSARDSGIAPEHQARPSLGETKDTLARLVTALMGEDPKAARESRRAALARRDVYAELEDNGIGCLSINAGTSSVVAAIDRIDQVARAVKAAGDERTLSQLRSDIAMSLLVHGTTTTPGSKERGSKTGGSKTGGVKKGDSHSGPPDHDGDGGPPDPDAHDRPPGPESPDESLDPEQPGLLGMVDEGIARILEGRPSVNFEVIVPLEALLDPEAPGVGAVPGRGYLTPEHVRELATQAGGVFHRLVTDPLDGRVVERSITAYRPDARMRAQIRAADVFCRAPGCRVPFDRCEKDHEVPYVDGVRGGLTSEINVDGKHKPHHQFKTWEVWKSEMDATRRVTWRTLFGRCYVTRAHDYRVYSQSPGSTPTPTTTPTTTPGEDSEAIPGLSSAVGDGDLQDRLIYAALCFRDTDGRLAADEDHPEYELDARERHLLHERAPIRLRHRIGGPGGRRRSGPPLGQLTPEEILAALGDRPTGCDAETERPFEHPPTEDPPF
ncbi:HNH endonuclease signature motif containing protein [Ornithinicoccus hortensis]|uniref:DUF222 domain-containing protein n=1 Tax=Ornithinicoccus hortensis TaxID=82346 RepID=A0A542YVZ3_9MICO|nr:HNH endonuclease signature motif containing protein [Ornithinicoccus hortensis]TQL52268.1 hypothetical protein FB467_3448 [Ornithinicoccus hortensis]